MTKTPAVVFMRSKKMFGRLMKRKKKFICKKKQRKVKIILFKAPISLNIEANSTCQRK